MKSLNRNEYWLLDLVHHGSFPLYRLTDPDLELIANRDGHGLSHSKLLETLHKLFQEDSLICVRFPDDETLIEVVPTYQDVDNALKAQDDIQYRLTIKGGSQWEILSNPDWKWFVNDSFDPRTNELIVEAGSLEVAEEYSHLAPYWYQFQLIPGSIKYHFLQPWQATYWKALPEGHQVSTQTVESPEIKLQRDMSPQEREFINHVWNWYENPFKA
jgi:hypothetical protein